MVVVDAVVVEGGVVVTEAFGGMVPVDAVKGSGWGGRGRVEMGTVVEDAIGNGTCSTCRIVRRGRRGEPLKRVVVSGSKSELANGK